MSIVQRSVSQIKQSAYFLVKVRVYFLCGVKQFVFLFRLSVSLFARDLALVRKQGISSESKELIHRCCKLLHVERILTFYQVLDIIKVARYGSLELSDLLLWQVVLGYFRVTQQHSSVRRVLPRLQPHVFLFVVCPCEYNFWGRLPSDGIVEYSFRILVAH